MKFIKSFLGFFTNITTVVLALVAVISINNYETVTAYLPMQVLGAAAATALPTALIYNTEFKTLKKFIIYALIHYSILCVIMITLGSAFGWINPSPIGIFFMCLYVAIVYAAVFAISYIREKKDADKLNKALMERRKK